jgi:hypothetical protein
VSSSGKTPGKTIDHDWANKIIGDLKCLRIC